MDACDAVVGETIPVRIDAESGAASYDPAPALEALFAWIGRLWVVVAALAAVGVAGILLLVRALRHNRRLAAHERAALLPPEGLAGPGDGPAVSCPEAAPASLLCDDGHRTSHGARSP